MFIVADQTLGAKGRARVCECRRRGAAGNMRAPRHFTPRAAPTAGHMTRKSAVMLNESQLYVKVNIIIAITRVALWGERERERYGECHKKSSPAQEESDPESTGPAK